MAAKIIGLFHVAKRDYGISMSGFVFLNFTALVCITLIY